jgi:hypothetical protein
MRVTIAEFSVWHVVSPGLGSVGQVDVGGVGFGLVRPETRWANPCNQIGHRGGAGAQRAGAVDGAVATPVERGGALPP